jgi:hypothetical protein
MAGEGQEEEEKKEQQEEEEGPRVAGPAGLRTVLLVKLGWGPSLLLVGAAWLHGPPSS